MGVASVQQPKGKDPYIELTIEGCTWVIALDNWKPLRNMFLSTSTMYLELFDFQRLSHRLKCTVKPNNEERYMDIYFTESEENAFMRYIISLRNTNLEETE
jgi:hypothetical protein